MHSPEFIRNDQPEISHGFDHGFVFHAPPGETPFSLHISQDGKQVMWNHPEKHADMDEFINACQSDMFRLRVVQVYDYKNELQDIDRERTVAQEYDILNRIDTNRSLEIGKPISCPVDPYYIVIQKFKNGRTQSQVDSRDRKDVLEVLRLYVQPNENGAAFVSKATKNVKIEARSPFNLKPEPVNLHQITQTDPLIITTRDVYMKHANVLHIDPRFLPHGVELNAKISRVDQHGYCLEYLPPARPDPIDFDKEVLKLRWRVYKEMLGLQTHDLRKVRLIDFRKALPEIKRELLRRCGISGVAGLWEAVVEDAGISRFEKKIVEQEFKQRDLIALSAPDGFVIDGVPTKSIKTAIVPDINYGFDSNGIPCLTKEVVIKPRLCKAFFTLNPNQKTYIAFTIRTGLKDDERIIVKFKIDECGMMKVSHYLEDPYNNKKKDGKEKFHGATMHPTEIIYEHHNTMPLKEPIHDYKPDLDMSLDAVQDRLESLVRESNIPIAEIHVQSEFD